MCVQQHTLQTQNEWLTWAYDSACPQPLRRSRIALLHAGSEALRHRQRALTAAAGRRQEAELARNTQRVVCDAHLAHATVPVLVDVDSVDLPAAAGGREARRLDRTRERGPTAPMDGGARLTGGSRKAR